MLIFLLFCAISALAYTPHAGMRLTMNNTFVSNAVHKIFPKAFEYIHQLINVTNSINLFPHMRRLFC